MLSFYKFLHLQEGCIYVAVPSMLPYEAILGGTLVLQVVNLII